LLGGLRFLYPFLVMDRSRQIATLRIISTLYVTFKSIQEEYSTLGVEKVILYCLHVTPYIATQASIQVLFDLAVTPSSNLRDSSSSFSSSLPLPAGATAPLPGALSSLNSKTIEKISRPEFMKLSVEIAVASPKRIQLARCTIEWLLGVCDDSLENIHTVLGTIGLIPFLLILSLWLCEDDLQTIENLATSLPPPPPQHKRNGDESTQETKTEILNSAFVKIESCPTLVDDRATSTQKYPKKPIDFILSSDPSNFKYSSLPYKIQIALAKFLRLIITGSVGQLSPLTIPVSQQTPTGFNLVHLTTLLSFIQYITRSPCYLPCYQPPDLISLPFPPIPFFLPLHGRHEEIPNRSSKGDGDAGINVTTPIHHPTSPHAWRLYAAQVELLLE
jgi:hypothetical protein